MRRRASWCAVGVLLAGMGTLAQQPITSSRLVDAEKEPQNWLTYCRFCHTLGGRGGDVGLDLSKAATKPARDLFLSLVAPRSAAGSAFAAIGVTMKDGQRFVGVKRDETPDAKRVYDTSSVSRRLIAS